MTTVDLRIFVISDDPLSRNGLVSIIGAHPGFIVAGQASAAGSKSACLQAQPIDIVVCDFGWQEPAPDSALWAAIADAGAEPEVPVVLLVWHAFDLHDLKRLPAPHCIRGVIGREVGEHSIVATLNAVAQGLFVSQPGFIGDAGQATGSGDLFLRALSEKMSKRELDVLALIAEGHPNRTIAHRLGISENTVKFHVNSILAKLNAQSRTEAAVIATRLGLVPL